MTPRRRRWIGAGILGSISIVLAAILAGPSLTVAASSPRSVGFVSVASVPKWPVGARTRGALSSSRQVSLSVALAPSDPSALDNAAAAVSTPSSPGYRHFLSPAQVTSEFGPDPTAAAAVRTWLSTQGLTVGPSLGDGLIIPVSGSASSVASAFHTELDAVDLASGRVAFANTAVAEVPSDLASSVQAVIGLNDLTELHANVPSEKGSKASGSKSSGSKSSSAKVAVADAPSDSVAVSPCSTLENDEGIATGATATVSQLSDFYNVGPLYVRGLDGTGVTVGLLEGGESYAADDIAALNACDATNSSVTTVPVDGGCAQCAVGLESTLDIETVMGFAPNAAIQVYQAPNLTNQSLLDDEAEVVSLDEAQVVSASVGECEPDAVASGRGYVEAEDDEFMDMALQGQSMFAASGDGGSEACVLDTGESPAYLSQLAVSDPGSQPYVTSVGGTSIGNVTSPSSVESVWNNGPFAEPDGNGASTGGISELWPMPSWQVGFDSSTDSSGVPCGASAGDDCREVPDVASSADPTRAGFLVVTDCSTPTISSCEVEPVGGTSVSAPFWASLAALGDQGAGGNERLGFLNPELYATDLALPDAFHDVTEGDNDYLSTANIDCGTERNLPCYEAAVGYDMASGLGTPNAASLFEQLDADVPTIATTGFPDATVGEHFNEAVAIVAGDGVTPFTWAVTGGSLPTGLQLDASTGVVTGEPTEAGTFPFTIEVSDHDGSVAAARLDIVVNSAPAVLTNSLADATEGVAYAATLGASGGTGPLSWSLGSGSLPNGVSLSGSGVLSGTPSATGVFDLAFEVTDANGVVATQDIAWSINAPPQIVDTLLANGVVGSSYSESLTSLGGTAPVAWSIGAGSALPSGLSLSAAGQIAGTPDVPGTFSFVIAATDANAAVATSRFSLTISTNTSSALDLRQKTEKIAVSSKASLVGVRTKTVKANGSQRSRITVTLRSASGRRVAGRTVALRALSGRSTIVVLVRKTNAKGVATFEVFDHTAQVVTYRAIDTSDKINLKERVTVHFIKP